MRSYLLVCLFLAAMSSSRSDVVTHFVSSFVRNQGFFSKPKEFQWCFKILKWYLRCAWCFKDQEVLRVYTENFKAVSRKFKGFFKEVLRVFQEIFKEVSRVFQGSFGETRLRSKVFSLGSFWV